LSQPDFAIARRIYSLSTSFYFYMFYMTLAAVEAVLAFLFGGTVLFGRFHVSGLLIPAAVLSPLLQLIISWVNEVLSLTVLALSPVVLISVSRTWSSLSRWRRSFLRFAIISNIESVPFEAADPRDKLFDAIIAANPDYERILNKARKLLQDERGEPTKVIPLDIFKNVTITYKRKSATFDVLIGHPPSNVREASARAEGLLRSKTVRDALRALSDIGITAGRIVDDKPLIETYIRFAEDLKLLSSYADSAVMRGFLVFNGTPSPELINYSSDKRNWPRHRSVRIPIVILSQEEKGYEVAVLAS
jgi:hypothetical protein